MPTVDILVPVYNRPEFLKECLASILAQSFRDFRVIVYDDGSDCPYDVPDDDRVEFIRGDVNRGIPYARNFLLDRISAPYAAWHDSDDMSQPTRIEEQLDLIKKTDVDIVFTYYFHRKGLPPVKIDVDRYGSEGPSALTNNIAFPTALFKAELSTFRFPGVRMNRAEDTFWITQLINAGKRFGIVKKPLYRLRRHEGRTSQLHLRTGQAGSKINKPGDED